MLSVQLAILGSYRLETLLEANDSESLEENTIDSKGPTKILEHSDL